MNAFTALIIIMVAAIFYAWIVIAAEDRKRK